MRISDWSSDVCSSDLGGFFEFDDQLLRNAGKIADIPGIIVHGRYDVVCPIQNAWDLHKAWPKAELAIYAASGHSAFAPANVDALVRATDGFARLTLAAVGTTTVARLRCSAERPGPPPHPPPPTH